MSFSFIDILTGNSASPEVVQLIEPTENTSQLGSGDVLATSDTNKKISPNAVCKYFNLRVQLGQNATNTHGWYEYAVVLSTEQDNAPTNAGLTNINTNTLGNLCINRFRGKCIWNGSVPLNQDQTKVLELSIKMPSKWCKWQRGQFLSLYHYYRPTDAVDNDTIKAIVSAQWKAYL